MINYYIGNILDIIVRGGTVLKKFILILSSSVLVILVITFVVWGTSQKTSAASNTIKPQSSSTVTSSHAKLNNKSTKVHKTTTTTTNQKTNTNITKAPTSSIKTTDVTSLTNAQWEKVIAKTNFMGPSDGPYPVIHKGENIWIDADVSKERIYIKNGDKTLYTMLTSSGLDTNPNDSTPQGTFYVQAEKGKTFYSPSEKEGANYWTSWKNHGEFLFHTVPIDKNGNYIISEAEKLGQKASHGCFRLPILDAKWIYENIPEGTKVVIHS